MVRSLVGNANIQVSLSFYVPGSGWTNPQGAGSLNPQGTAWTLSNPSPLPNPPGAGNTNTWQVVRFVFAGGGGKSDSQFYGLGVSALPPPPSTGPCSDPVLTQAFLPANDRNYYTQAPDFSAWTLTNGAQVEPATLGDGSTGQVLDLPAGSMAVSPNICVTSAYPTARMMIRSLLGGDDMSFRVSYANTNTWTNPHETGHVHGNLANWTLSDSVNLQPANTSGWQIVRLTLVAQRRATASSRSTICNSTPTPRAERADVEMTDVGVDLLDTIAMRASAADAASDRAAPRSAERLLEESWAGRQRKAGQREIVTEGVAALAFLAVALPLGLPAMLAGRLNLSLVVLLVCLYGLVGGAIRFPIGAGYLVPTYAILVPMLLLLPPATVPLMAAAGSSRGRRGSPVHETGPARAHPVRDPQRLVRPRPGGRIAAGRELTTARR